MIKFNSKSYAIVFFTLLILQFIMVYADAKLGASSVFNEAITIFSLPINFIDENLPFYVRESIFTRTIFWLMNVLVQASLIYLVWSSFNRAKKKMK